MHSMMTLEQAREALATVDQNHVWRFWDALSTAQQQQLLSQVSALDLHALARMRAVLREQGAPAEGSTAIEPAPVSVLAGADRVAAHKTGEALLRDGKVGVILVAGGQGSRLGFEGPKGAFPIGPISRAPLFFFHARKILALERMYDAEIPFYVMTSDSNDADTRACFETHGYFGLNPSRVHFFTQGMWPALDADGHLIMERPDRLFMSPDGHGGTLSALRSSGMLDDMAGRGLACLFYFQVDNPLVEVADPVFLGFHALRLADISIKVCAKRAPDEKLGVVVHRDGRVAMVEYTELTPAQQHAVLPDGRLKFSHGSVAIHVFDFEFLRQQATVDLPLHLAHKKVPYCGPAGTAIVPDRPNAYKFEKFIFDVIPNARQVGILDFDRAEEFSPVKNKEGEDSPATVMRDLEAKWARWLDAIGAIVPRDRDGWPRHRIEIDPAFAHTPERLRAGLKTLPLVEGDLRLGD